MATHSDYLPQKEDDLLDWAENFSRQVTTNAAEWQIPADEATALKNAVSGFRESLAQTNTPAKNSQPRETLRHKRCGYLLGGA